jgi:hypothetical protein
MSIVHDFPQVHAVYNVRAMLHTTRQGAVPMLPWHERSLVRRQQALAVRLVVDEAREPQEDA